MAVFLNGFALHSIVSETDIIQKETLRHMRSFCKNLVDSDRNPIQLWIGLLRYAAHTIIFDESNELQLAVALYSATVLQEKIARALHKSGKLRIDLIDNSLLPANSKLGLTILPGCPDSQRNIAEDLTTIKQEEIPHIVCLVPYHELDRYGVANLIQEYKKYNSESGFCSTGM